MNNRPRLLIEDWLPAAAIGVECTRERSTGQQPPDKRLHVWWARRPLVASRAAVLASLLPADFPRDVFERLLGFWGSGRQVLQAQRDIDLAREFGERIENPHGDRAFKQIIRESDLKQARAAAESVWGSDVTIIDPMAGGGSIPFESARLGFHTLANEYNPVACSVLEATVDYPFRFGGELARKASKWGRVWRKRFIERMARFYPNPNPSGYPPHCYIFTRTIPCPDTGHHTPLVPGWHLLKPKTEHGHIVAEPVVDKEKGTWTVRIREIGRGAGQLREVPRATYSRGKGISLFTNQQIPGDYIKAMAQQGKMQNALYAVVVKTNRGLEFRLPEPVELKALEEAEAELERLRPEWERANVIPTEDFPTEGSDLRPRLYGMPRWSDLFTPRQLLCAGALVMELRNVAGAAVRQEGGEAGEVVAHLLSLCLDKFLNHNCSSTRWECTRSVIKGKMDRHDYAFKPAFAEMAPCNAGTGLEWAIDNVLDAYKGLAKLPRSENSQPVPISIGSATSLPELDDGSITAVIVDPPYAANVQYSELADFFYVWLKRTQGYRHPEWFSTYLCDHSEEAVVNLSRFRDGQPAGKRAREARKKATEFYQKMMTEVFRECHRILRDDGVLTVMFTHKKQEAWAALFESLIAAGFTITATWPVRTESEHSLHQARKNAAQSTVLLVARKRDEDAGIGYFNLQMRRKIREVARTTAERLQAEGLTAVDQLVGTFGPAMEVFSRHSEIRTDTGEPRSVGDAIAEAADAVIEWRIQRLAERGLDGVEPEGQFVFLCWDVLGAAEFRFNEARLLGHAVGMDVDQLIAAGLVAKKKNTEMMTMIPARDRRRKRALTPDEVEETLFGPVTVPKRRTKKDVLQVHPNDPQFRTAIDACHALALRYVETGGGAAGVGSCKALLRQQTWTKDSPVAKLMEALVHAAPEALRFEKGEKSMAAQFPEFRAWHELLEPLFGIEPPKWEERKPERTLFSHLEEPKEDDGEEEE
ncbi:MAG: DUF1156 domain-containing protein [Planctomycetes bacterium]|nr:DUF1156 domain-containing protein [Planctomycetota bacterium]